MKHGGITRRIIGAAYAVYDELDFGFLESVYKKAMIIDLGHPEYSCQSCLISLGSVPRSLLRSR